MIYVILAWGEELYAMYGDWRTKDFDNQTSQLTHEQNEKPCELWMDLVATGSSLENSRDTFRAGCFMTFPVRVDSQGVDALWCPKKRDPMPQKPYNFPPQMMFSSFSPNPLSSAEQILKTGRCINICWNLWYLHRYLCTTGFPVSYYIHTIFPNQGNRAETASGFGWSQENTLGTGSAMGRRVDGLFFVYHIIFI